MHGALRSGPTFCRVKEKTGCRRRVTLTEASAVLMLLALMIAGATVAATDLSFICEIAN
jgi:hypothetical protein